MTDKSEASTKFKYPHARILQFAKSPRLGKVKTRLASVLSDQQSLSVHRMLVEHCFRTLTQSSLAPVDLWLDRPADEHLEFWAEIGAKRFKLQATGDLGARMHAACVETLQPQGKADALVLVGSDCPMLNADIIDDGLAALYGGADVVLGPALDGGYYLVGLKRPHSDLFREVPWGTSKVFDVTKNRLDSMALSWAQMKPLADLDRPEDLPLLANLPLSFQVRHKIIFNMLNLKNI